MFLVGPVTPAQFATACRQMAVVHRWGLWKERQGSYPYNSTPTKAVHLWRHPLDNIVARYRHARRYVPAWLLPNLAWYCRLTDMITGKIWAPSSSSSYFPCRAELHRFITWHNNAMALADTIHPTFQVLHVHYEDYRRNDTLSTVLEFLELDQLASPSIRFRASPSSHHHHHHNTTTTTMMMMTDGYFTRPHQERMMAYIQKYASPRVWERLQVYTNDDDHGNDSLSD
jgi:hypothetical protein